jgi:hypothetical protein
MTRFGFSAYLKVICANDVFQRATLKERLGKKKKSGQDYHWHLKNRVQRLVNGEPIDSVLDSVSEISIEKKRKSVKKGLKQFAAWRSSFPGKISAGHSVTYTSPNNAFVVVYEPHFCIDIDGVRTAVHLWNTEEPDLIAHMVFGALEVLPALYAESPDVPQDFAILSLRNKSFYRLSEAPKVTGFGDQIALFVEAKIAKVMAEMATTLSGPKSGEEAA